MTRAYIGLGANLGDPHRALATARGALTAQPGVEDRGASSIYRSAAVGPGAQPDYLNAVLSIETTLEPEALLDRLQALEAAAGRQRGERWGPRSLDLDLLLFGAKTIRTRRLSVPHPELYQRNFVLLPLAELVPDNWSLPDDSRIDERITRCPANPIERTQLDWHTADSQCSAARTISQWPR